MIKLTAVCMSCCGEGSFTKRISTETALELIGGTDKYIAACRTCKHTGGGPSSVCLSYREQYFRERDKKNYTKDKDN